MVARRIKRARTNPALSSLHGLVGGHEEGMSATAFQRQRRRLLEQTSVSARMNEEGDGDPYAKTLANYDEVGIQDTGERHQAGDPPPTSETGHTPEQLPEAQRIETQETEEDGLWVAPSDVDVGTLHQEGDPPLTSVELREGEEPDLEAGEVYEDQARYAALDKRKYASTEASEANVDLPSGAEAGDEPIGDVVGRGEYAGSASDDLSGKSLDELKQIASDENVEGRSGLNKSELTDAIRSNRS